MACKNLKASDHFTSTLTCNKNARTVCVCVCVCVWGGGGGGGVGPQTTGAMHSSNMVRKVSLLARLWLLGGLGLVAVAAHATGQP